MAFISELRDDELTSKVIQQSVLQTPDGGGAAVRRNNFQHRWTSENRVILSLLVERFSNGLSEITPVFNDFYRGALPKVHGLNESTLRVQWNEIRTQKKKFDIQASLEDITASPLTKVDCEEDLLVFLESKASTIGITLIRKPTGPAGVLPQLQKRKRVNHNESIAELYSSEDDLSLQKIPKQSRLSAPALPTTPTHRYTRDGLMTPPSSEKVRGPSTFVLRGKPNSPTKSRNATNKASSIQSKAHMVMPMIGFRGYSEYSQGRNNPRGFVAGAFTNIARIPPTPKIDDPLYRREALRHVAWTKTSLSPFISLTINPVRAIMVASRMNKKSKGFLAMIDLYKLNNEGVLQDARSLDLERDSSVKYHSGGEYLVWGQIREGAIISVIATNELMLSPPAILGDPDPFDIRMITEEAWSSVWARIQINKNRLSMSYQAGIAVGQFARMLRSPLPYLDGVVDRILEEWNFEKRNVVPWKSNEIFYDGVRDGFIKQIETDSMASTDPNNLEGEPEADNFIIELEQAAEQTRQSPCAVIAPRTNALLQRSQHDQSLRSEPVWHGDKATLPKLSEVLPSGEHDEALNSDPMKTCIPNESNGLPFKTNHISQEPTVMLDFDSLHAVDEEEEGCDIMYHLQGPQSIREDKDESAKAKHNDSMESYAYTWTGI